MTHRLYVVCPSQVLVLACVWWMFWLGAVYSVLRKSNGSLWRRVTEKLVSKSLLLCCWLQGDKIPKRYNSRTTANNALFYYLYILRDGRVGNKLSLFGVIFEIRQWSYNTKLHGRQFLYFLVKSASSNG